MAHSKLQVGATVHRIVMPVVARASFLLVSIDTDREFFTLTLIVLIMETESPTSNKDNLAILSLRSF